jgi:hypothetical protein
MSEYNTVICIDSAYELWVSWHVFVTMTVGRVNISSVSMIEYMVFSVLNYKTVFLQIHTHFEIGYIPLFIYRMSVVHSFIIN